MLSCTQQGHQQASTQLLSTDTKHQRCICAAKEGGAEPAACARAENAKASGVGAAGRRCRGDDPGSRQRRPHDVPQHRSRPEAAAAARGREPRVAAAVATGAATAGSGSDGSSSREIRRGGSGAETCDETRWRHEVGPTAAAKGEVDAGSGRATRQPAWSRGPDDGGELHRVFGGSPPDLCRSRGARRHAGGEVLGLQHLIPPVPWWSRGGGAE